MNTNIKACMNKLTLKNIITSSVVLVLFGCEKPAEHSVVSASGVAVEYQQTSLDSASEGDNNKTSDTIKTLLPASAFMSAEWVDLIPKDDLQVLLNPPSYIDYIPENSAEDQLNAPFANTAGDQSENSNSSTDSSTNSNTNSITGESNNALYDIATNSNTNTSAIDTSEVIRYKQALASTRVIAELNNVPVRMPAFIVPLEFDDEQRVTQFFMVPFFGACIHEPPPPPNQTIFVNYPQGFILPSLTEPYWISGVLKTSLVENELAVAAYTIEMHAYELYTEE